MKWLEKFIDNLKVILKEPPYEIFIFVGSIILIISIIFKRYFDQFFVIFLYSIAGSIWRYISKDIDSGIQKLFKRDEHKNISHLVVITIYHIGNISLLLLLFHYLKLI